MAFRSSKEADKTLIRSVMSNKDDFSEFKPPGTPFCYNEVDVSWATWQKASRHDWIEKVGERSTGAALWETTEGLWSAIEQYVES